MSVSLEEINRITVRNCFKPFVERLLREVGVNLSVPWNPSDEELEKLLHIYVKVSRELDQE